MSKLRQFLLNSVIGSALFSTRARVRLLRLVGLRVGARSGVFPYSRFLSGDHVSLGEDVFVNAGVIFDAGALIELGPGVSVGPGVRFITSTHEVGPSYCRGGGPTKYHPITVGAGTWIGAGATILPGVTIGPGCIVASGAVVTGNCEADGLYAGVPATRHRTLDGATTVPALPEVP